MRKIIKSLLPGVFVLLLALLSYSCAKRISLTDNLETKKYGSTITQKADKRNVKVQELWFTKKNGELYAHVKSNHKRRWYSIPIRTIESSTWKVIENIDNKVEVKMIRWDKQTRRYIGPNKSEPDKWDESPKNFVDGTLDIDIHKTFEKNGFMKLFMFRKKGKNIEVLPGGDVDNKFLLEE